MQLHKLSIGYGSIILVLFYFSTTSYGFLNDSENNAFLRKCNNNDQDKSEERRTIISHMPKRTTTDIPESSRQLNLDRRTTVSNRKNEFNFRDTVNINTRLLDRNNNRISADENLDKNSIRRQRTSDDRRQMVRTRRASSDSNYSPNRKNTIDDFRSAGNSLQKPTLARRTHNRASSSNQQDVSRTQVKRSTDDLKDSRTFDRQSNDRTIGNDRVGQQQYRSQSLHRDVKTQRITHQDRNGILSTITRSSLLERNIVERRDAPNKERKNINDRRQILSDDKIRRVSDASSRVSSAPITRRSLIDRRQSSDRRELRTLETRENRRITEVSNSDDRRLASEITSKRPDRRTKENIDDRRQSATREIVSDDRRRRVALVLRDVPSPVRRVSIYRRTDRREPLSDDRRHSLERRELVSDDRKSSEARVNRRVSDTQIANRIVNDRRHSSVRRELDSDDQRRSPESTAPRQSRRIDSGAYRRELVSDDRRHSLERREFVSDVRKRSSEAREIANRIVNDRRQSSIRRELGSDDRRLSSEHTAARQMRRLTESRFDTRRDYHIPRRILSENNNNRRELISSPRQSSQRRELISDDRRRLSEARGNRLLSDARSDDRGQAFERRELIFYDRRRKSEATTNRRVSDAQINRQILNENINSRRQYSDARRRSSEARENRRVSDVRSDARIYRANINDRGQSSRRGERISDDRSSEARETRRVSQIQINSRILGENVIDRRQSSERRKLISDDRRRLSEARGNRRASESDAQVNRRINDRGARNDDQRRSELKSDVRRDDRITRRNVDDHRQFSVRRKLVFNDRRQSSIRRNHPDSVVMERRVPSDTFVRGKLRKVTSPERALSHNTNEGRSLSEITSKIVTLRSNRSQRVLAERRDAPMTRRILKEVGARVSEARSETRTRQETRTRNFAEVNFLADKLISYEVDWGNLAKSLLIAVILFEILANTYPKKIRFHKMSNFLGCTKQKVQ